MTLKITTVYENVDQEWVDFWLHHCGQNYGFNPDSVEPGEDFTHVMKSKDPTHSRAMGTTTINLYSNPEYK